MLEQYRYILAQPHWQSTPDSLSPEKRAWLLHQGSLTQKLLQITKQLAVEVVQQGWQTKYLENSTACEWWREVFLKEGDIAWIFAQTLIPQMTIEKVAQKVLTLNNEPIGLWLFSQHPQRVSLEWQKDSNTALYARRATYLLNGYPLVIQELFLPEFTYPN